MRICNISVRKQQKSIVFVDSPTRILSYVNKRNWFFSLENLQPALRLKKVGKIPIKFRISNSICVKIQSVTDEPEK